MSLRNYFHFIIYVLMATTLGSRGQETWWQSTFGLSPVWPGIELLTFRAGSTANSAEVLTEGVEETVAHGLTDRRSSRGRRAKSSQNKSFTFLFMYDQSPNFYRQKYWAYWNEIGDPRKSVEKEFILVYRGKANYKNDSYSIYWELGST